MLRIEVERFSLTTAKPFDEVVAGLNAAIGHPDMTGFARSTHEARSFAELRSAVEKGLSKAGLMLFMQLDHGAVLRKETRQDTPRIIRFIIGSPLIMKEMVKYVPDAGSYAPVTVLVDERADGVHLSYDKVASFLAPYGNAEPLSQTNQEQKVRNVVLVHGGFVDGSGWEGVYNALKKNGYAVTVVQEATTSFAADSSNIGM